MGIEIILVVLAAGIGGILGTAVYREILIKPVSDIIKAIIPGNSIEPKIGQILQDLGKMLQNGDDVQVKIESTNGDKKNYIIKSKDKK